MSLQTFDINFVCLMFVAHLFCIKIQSIYKLHARMFDLSNTGWELGLTW